MLGALEQKQMNWKDENTEHVVAVVDEWDGWRYQIHRTLSSWPKIDVQIVRLSLHLQDQLLL